MRIAAETSGNPAFTQAVSGGQNAQSVRSAVKNQDTGGSFDQLNISQDFSSESKFQKMLAARLVQDVRTATSTGDIQQIRTQVMNGTYQINPSAIASAMLLGG